MSVQSYSPEPSPEAANGSGLRIRFLTPRPRKRRYWLHILLLILTLLTTTAVGARLSENFRLNRPAFNLEEDIFAFAQLFSDPSLFLSGLPFALTLMLILLAHELGHYLACTYYRIDASLPFFLPAPTLIGTLGAFIRIRSPIYSRRVLFDVGIAGPLAGFVFVIPAMAIGLAFSKTLTGIANSGDLIFGTPILLKSLEAVVFPGVASADIYLHPVARAAWVGAFATALNLLPIGQLDGGHVMYAFFQNRHALLSRLFVAALIPLGFFFWYGWLFWAGLLFFFGMRHPAIYDFAGMGEGRRRLGWLVLIVFLLSFTLAPIRANNGF